MFDLVIRKQDTLPVISRKAYQNGSPVILTNFDVSFVVSEIDGTELINNPAVVVDGGDENEMQYQWTAADSAAVTAGPKFGKFVATHVDEQLTVPNNKPISIIVTDDSSFEYSYSGDPSSRGIDKVRFILQDTNTSSALLTDSEIEFLIDEYGSPYEASVFAAETLSARFASYAKKTIGPMSVDYGSVSTQMSALADRLRIRASKGTGAKAMTTQVKRDKPIFRIGMNDNGRSYYPNSPETGGL